MGSVWAYPRTRPLDDSRPGPTNGYRSADDHHLPALPSRHRAQRPLRHMENTRAGMPRERVRVLSRIPYVVTRYLETGAIEIKER